MGQYSNHSRNILVRPDSEQTKQACEFLKEAKDLLGPSVQEDNINFLRETSAAIKESAASKNPMEILKKVNGTLKSLMNTVHEGAGPAAKSMRDTAKNAKKTMREANKGKIPAVFNDYSNHR